MPTLTPAKPDRFTGLPAGVMVGPPGRRLAAHLIDAVVPAVLLAVVLGTSGDASEAVDVVAYVLLALWGLIVWWMLATRAAGPGMRLTKLQLVGFSDGRPIGWARVLIRAIIFSVVSVSGLGLVLLLISLLRHPRYQGWHDRAGDAVVIVERMLAPRTLGATQAASPPADEAAPEPRPLPPPVLTPAVEPVKPVAAAPVPAPTPTATPPNPAPTPREQPAAPAAAPSTWVAVLDDGREVPVRGLVVLGRNPQSRPGEEAAELVKVADETRTVSKSHLALNVDAVGLLVADRSSTNGSTVTTPDGATTACVPEQAVRVSEGSVVSMGDHWLTVRRD
jgi:hypothetical protein